MKFKNSICFRLATVFGYSYRSNLNLITCTGDFNREKGTHEERLVVYTELAKVEKQ